jgi:hypothetical protein
MDYEQSIKNLTHEIDTYYHQNVENRSDEEVQALYKFTLQLARIVERDLTRLQIK